MESISVREASNAREVRHEWEHAGTIKSRRTNASFLRRVTQCDCQKSIREAVSAWREIPPWDWPARVRKASL